MPERRQGADRRKHERVKMRLQVRFGPGDLAHSGYTQDVSESGIYLQASVIYPPNTILVLQIEYAEGPATARGIVRWSKDLPPAFKRSLRAGMGVEFLEAKGIRAGARRAEAAPETPIQRTHRAGVPPDVAEPELENGVAHRRQVSTHGGDTFEVLLTEYRGGWYVRVFQLPRTDGSSEAAFRQSFWTREEADSAVKAFLRGL